MFYSAWSHLHPEGEKWSLNWKRRKNIISIHDMSSIVVSLTHMAWFYRYFTCKIVPYKSIFLRVAPIVPTANYLTTNHQGWDSLSSNTRGLHSRAHFERDETGTHFPNWRYRDETNVFWSCHSRKFGKNLGNKRFCQLAFLKKGFKAL